MAFLVSEREKIYEEDVAGGVSVSESILAKFGSTANFIFDRIVQRLEFGIAGNFFSVLATPYTFTGNSEVAIESYLIQRVSVSLQVSGISGQTEFKLERRLSGSGTWTNMFSTNLIISNTAADNLYFLSTGSAPSGVTLPVLSITTLAAGDEVRGVLVTAADQARNLQVNLEVSPT